MNLCNFKYIFGKPKEGAHFHVFGIAIIDLFLTIIASLLIAYYIIKYNTKLKKNLSLLTLFIIIFILLMILSIFVHKLFCVETTLSKLF